MIFDVHPTPVKNFHNSRPGVQRPGTRHQAVHLAQINLIRVLAMLGIFLHHAWKGAPRFDETSLFMKLLRMGFDFGSLGVVFFNIASGFVLALPCLGWRGDRTVPEWGRFMKRRFLRIVPPYYLAIIVFSICNILIFHQEILSSLVMFLTHALFLQSFRYSMLMTDFASYWYLSMLAQFYLLFPLVLRLFCRLGPGKAFFLVCVVCWGGYELLDLYVRMHPESILGMADYLAYFNLPARLPEFAAGMWLATAWKPESSRYRLLPFSRSFSCLVGSALLFAAAGAFFAAEMHTPLRTVYEGACCFLVFMALFVPGWSIWLGGSRMVSRLAGASYSIYLVHQPVLSYIYRWIAGTAFPLGELGLLVVVAAPVCVGLGFSVDWLAGCLTARVDRFSRSG
jgi:peptidoglycan/LPS O-acetylase OafA/YrhL